MKPILTKAFDKHLRKVIRDEIDRRRKVEENKYRAKYNDATIKLLALAIATATGYDDVYKKGLTPTFKCYLKYILDKLEGKDSINPDWMGTQIYIELTGGLPKVCETCLSKYTYMYCKNECPTLEGYKKNENTKHKTKKNTG